MDKTDVAYKTNVGRRLALLREFQGLSQGDFAASINASPSQLSNWEKGRQRLSLEGAMRVNKVYGTSLDFLFLDRRSELSASFASFLSERLSDSDTNQSSDKPVS